MTSLLASALPLGAVALAAPAPPPPPPPASKASPPAVDAKKEPAAAAGLTALPLEVEGKLSSDSQGKLGERLRAAVAAAKVSGSYRARLAVRTSSSKKSKKTSFALTLTVLGAGDAVVATQTDECKACSLAEVGARIDALVQQAAQAVAAKQPPPPTVASVSVRSEPLGARVLVDGSERGVTPQVVELPPGEHTIALDKPGFVAQEQKLTVEAGDEQELVLTLVAEPPPPAKGRKVGGKPTAGTNAGRGLKIGGAVMLGLGLAGVAAGVAMILVDEDPMPLKCPDEELDFRGVCRYRYDTLLGGIIGTAAGGVGVAGGLAMMIKGRQVAVKARAGKQQASLGVIVRF